VDRVIQELQYLQDHGHTKGLQINDDTFTLDVNRAKEICRKIIEADIHIPLHIETRPDTCDKELIDLLQKAGVNQISFGLESASPPVLQKAKKAPGKEKEFLRKVKLCTEWAKNKGITVWVSTIFGLPGETLKDAKKTLEFVKELPVDGYIHNVLSVYEGTELFSARNDYGLNVDHSPFFLPYITEHSYDVSKVPWLPGSQIDQQIATWERAYKDIVSYDTEGNGYQYVVLKEMPDNTLYTWLKRVCVLPVTVLDTTENLSRSKAVTHLTTLIDHEVPVGSYLMWLNQLEPVVVKYSTIMDLEIPVKEIPFCAKDHGDTSINRNINANKNTDTNTNNGSNTTTHRVYTIKNAEDIKAVTVFINSHQKNGILSFSLNDISGTIKSACRWGESVCPAVSGGILVVNGECVLSCVHGGCIGKVGDDIPVLKKNLQDLKKKKEKERNCYGCQVEKMCSHCLFPYPFTDTEFCTLKREHVNTAKVVTLMKLVNYFPGKKISMKLLNGPPLFYKGVTTDKKLIDETVQLISVDGTAYAFTKDWHFYSLGKEAAIILEAFQVGASHKDLVTYLCEHAHVSQQEAAKAISDTKSLVESLGFLNEKIAFISF
jgi:hypothetical protein